MAAGKPLCGYACLAEQPTLILLGRDTRTRELLDPALPSLNLPNYRIMEVGSGRANRLGRGGVWGGDRAGVFGLY